jgi:hypothetical protein
MDSFVTQPMGLSPSPRLLFFGFCADYRTELCWPTCWLGMVDHGGVFADRHAVAMTA